jgi:hypothetical protein
MSLERQTTYSLAEWESFAGAARRAGAANASKVREKN